MLLSSPGEGLERRCLVLSFLFCDLQPPCNSSRPCLLASNPPSLLNCFSRGSLGFLIARTSCPLQAHRKLYLPSPFSLQWYLCIFTFPGFPRVTPFGSSFLAL